MFTSSSRSVFACVQKFRPVTLGQARDAVEDLGERDRGGEQLAGVSIQQPLDDAGTRRRLHELGDNVGLDDDHSDRSAARAGVDRSGSSKSSPPMALKRSNSVMKRPFLSTCFTDRFGVNGGDLRLHRSAVSSGADAQPLFDLVVEVTDRHSSHRKPPIGYQC